MFVYGTLMTGEPRHHLLEAGGIRSITPASISGELLDMGEYPALRLSSHTNRRVYGELIEFEALDKVIDRVDEEEGPAFRREFVNVTLDNGTSHFALTYVLASDAGLTHARHIESGRWRGRAAKA
jgi:gamma-glutamylcyclotransferase (GGCT)/AIG2-like uncharacterized protein YtfP